MDWTHWIIDASMPAPDGLLCFCPVELNADGEVEEIVTGMNFVSDKPPGGKCIGAFHDAGQEACEEWCAANREAYERACTESK